MTEPDICEVGGGGFILPFSDEEQTWPKPARTFMYVVILGWFFLGVSIIADIFMASIEAITSKRKQYRLQSGQTVYVRVWNATVANLTLMALGSSAPEILLNVIEIFSNEFYAGELGPSTIVGSAAFNLLVIIAVCVYVIPAGEARTLRQPDVFKVTAFCSVFAYVWLIFILAVSSPDLVEAWEGIMTFCFFPVLVVVAFVVDNGMCSREKWSSTEEEKQLLQAHMMEKGMEISDEDALMVLRARDEEEVGKSKAAWRAENALTAAKGISPTELCVGFVTQRFCFHEATTRLELEVEKSGSIAMDTRVGVEYRTCDGNMMHSRGHYYPATDYIDIPAGQKVGFAVIERSPASVMNMIGDKQDSAASRKTADSGERSPSAAAETGSVDDEEARAVEAFFHVQIIRAVKLSNACYSKPDANRQQWPARSSDTENSSNFPISVKPQAEKSPCSNLVDEMNSKESSCQVPVMPDRGQVQVAITNIEESGHLRFENPEVTFAGRREEDEVKVTVQRFSGGAGELTCRYTTEADTARSQYDYVHTEGELVFPPGVMSHEIVVKILPKNSWEASDRFFVVLSDIPGRPQCVLEDFAICGITISADSADGLVNNVMRLMDKRMNLDSWQQGNREWKEQWIAAFRPNSGDEDDLQQASAGEWTLHIIALPWKVLFALVPPPAYCNGWLCFCVALGMIGVVTAFVGDLAGLLGCVMGLKPGITAITIVAVGTSLPDTFASMLAAVEDPTADNAVGNVTGSNSVNVFLGLGLPWMIASIVWTTKGKTDEWRLRYPAQDAKYPSGGFVVVAGDLVYSVIVFSLAAMVCIGVIWYRRLKFQAELGGPVGYKVNTSVFFVLLWFFYVGISSWKTTAGDVSTGAMMIALVVGVFAIVVGMVIITAMLTMCKYIRNSKQSDADRIIDAIREQNAMTAIGAVAASNGSLPEAVMNLQEHIAGLNVVCRALESLANKDSDAVGKGKPHTKRRSSLKVGGNGTISMTPKKAAGGKKKPDAKKSKKSPDDAAAAASAVPDATE